MDKEQMMALLAECMKDPDLKKMLGEIATPNVGTDISGGIMLGKPMKIEDGKDIPKSTLDQKLAEIDKSTKFHRTSRPPVSIIDKQCSCGRTEKVVRGGTLDTEAFKCNKCLIG